MSKKRLAMFVAIGLLGVLLVGFALSGKSEVEATADLGGIEAIVTPHYGCESIVWNGQEQMRCDDGFEVVRPFESSTPDD